MAGHDGIGSLLRPEFIGRAGAGVEIARGRELDGRRGARRRRREARRLGVVIVHAAKVLSEKSVSGASGSGL